MGSPTLDPVLSTPKGNKRKEPQTMGQPGKTNAFNESDLKFEKRASMTDTPYKESLSTNETCSSAWLASINKSPIKPIFDP